MEELATCSNCDEEVTTDSDFCPHCGVLFVEDDSIRCQTHTEKPASGVCILCRTLICSSCSMEEKGRLLCEGHAGVSVQEDWAEVFRSTDVNEAEMAKAFLESQGFKIHMLNFGSIGYVWDGGGESPLSRSALNKPVQVFVPIPDYLQAKGVLEDWQFSDKFQE